MQELEKILEEIESEALHNPEIGRRQCEGMAMAMNIIRKHMNDDWIPVEERLPEEGQYVLTTWEKPNYRKNTTEIYISVLKLNQEDEWTGDCGSPNGRVVAWRPLPEPYRPERSKE